MTTHTIEVTDIDEDLLRSLDKRASQQAQDRSAYVRDLLRRDLAETHGRAEAPATQKTFAEILAPIHESVRQSGYTEEEVIGFFDEALREVRAERRQKAKTPSSKTLKWSLGQSASEQPVNDL